MPKLRLEQAPAATLPLRFLLAVPCWGVLGSVLLLIDGGAALQNRWPPETLALVHVWTLGVLGNAMFGSLLQFLPVAAGATLHGGRGVPWLHALFNVGVALLVVGFQGGVMWMLLVAGTLLPLCFIWLAAIVLPGLARATSERLLRLGVAAAMSYGVLAAVFGAALVLQFTGHDQWPLAAVDAHAAFGVLGWMILLLAAVGRVTLPMFQATHSVSARAQGIWLAAVTLGLPLAAAWHWRHDGWVLPLAVALGGGAFALAVTCLQWPVPRARQNALFRHWRVGTAALLLAALVLLFGRGLVAGVLAIGVGLPLLIGAMAMEIVPFVVWIALRARIRRGVQLPGVQRLLADTAKRRVLRAQLVAAPLLVLAVLWPQPWLVRAAALAQLAAWSLHGYALASVLRVARDFIRRTEAA